MSNSKFNIQNVQFKIHKSNWKNGRHALILSSEIRNQRTDKRIFEFFLFFTGILPQEVEKRKLLGAP